MRLRTADFVLTLEEIARPTGDTRGLTFVGRSGGDVRCTYDTLRAAAAGAAAAMRGRGVRCGDRVMLGLENNAASVAALLGAWMLGCTIVSVPPPPRHAVESYRRRLGALYRDLDVRLVVGSRRTTDLVDDSSHEAMVAQYDPPDVVPDDPCHAIPPVALIQFTSGTSGPPTPVALTADAIARNIFAIAAHLELDPDRDSSVSWLPLFHDMGLIGFVLTPLAIRADAAIMSPLSFVRRPESWLQTCASMRATITGAPNFAYRLTSQLRRRDMGDLSSVRAFLCGAERVSYAVLRTFADAFRSHGASWQAILPVYGMAEAVLAVTMPELGRGPLSGPEGVASVGRALTGAEVRVDGDEDDQEGVGTVALRAEWLFEGYVRSGRVAPALVDGWFHTADVANVRSGELFVLGRKDHVVVVHGRNVSAGELDEAMEEEVGDDVQAVAAFVDMNRLGVVFEVPEPFGTAAELTASRIRRVLLSDYGVLPRPLVAVTRGSIPRTTSGKVVRSMCGELSSSNGWRNARFF